MEQEEKQVGTEMSSPEGMTYYANMELTAYVWTGNPCADGVYPAEGYTAACNDPALWHKWVYIDGVGLRYIHDTGGMASNVIDIYVKDIDVATQFGRQVADVYILED
jgi:3D (Asp-Asp-Asp) domain-containing protein